MSAASVGGHRAALTSGSPHPGGARHGGRSYEAPQHASRALCPAFFVAGYPE